MLSRRRIVTLEEIAEHIKEEILKHDRCVIDGHRAQTIAVAAASRLVEAGEQPPTSSNDGDE